MMLKETLRRIVRTQKDELDSIDHGILREDLARIAIETKFATVISGVRRCGKSTLMRQLMARTGEAHYLNFDDLRIAGLEARDLPRLKEVLVEENGDRDHYFFDEIQNVDGWEVFVRGLLDAKKKVVITGSNASLLSRELGTRLTGRHLTYELFPFSYREFLEFRDLAPGKESFREFLLKGGFPEYLRLKRQEVLRLLLNDVLLRDIAVRHGVRNIKTLREMSLFLLTNVGKEFSYNTLRKSFGMGSPNSAISFVSFLEDSYLLFTVPMFDTTLRRSQVNPKKAYSVDNGLSVASSTSLTEDWGRLLENAVFQELRRTTPEVYYYKGKEGECDFLTRGPGQGAYQTVQVCYELDEDNREREMKGMVEAMHRFRLKEGFVITMDQEDEVQVHGAGGGIGGKKTVRLVPAWKWMMGRGPNPSGKKRVKS